MKLRLRASRFPDQQCGCDGAAAHYYTCQGFELEFGVNHLAHMALTMKLLPLLQRVGGQARVVTVTSGAQYFGRIALDGLQSEQPAIFGRPTARASWPT